MKLRDFMTIIRDSNTFLGTLARRAHLRALLKGRKRAVARQGFAPGTPVIELVDRHSRGAGQ